MTVAAHIRSPHPAQALPMSLLPNLRRAGGAPPHHPKIRRPVGVCGFFLSVCRFRYCFAVFVVFCFVMAFFSVCRFRYRFAVFVVFRFVMVSKTASSASRRVIREGEAPLLSPRGGREGRGVPGGSPEGGGGGGGGGLKLPPVVPGAGFCTVFWVLFSVSFWVLLFSLLKPNMAPTWAPFGGHVGHLLGHCWVLLWHPHSSSISDAISIDF